MNDDRVVTVGAVTGGQDGCDIEDANGIELGDFQFVAILSMI